MGQNEELSIPVISIIGNALRVKLKDMPSDPSSLPIPKFWQTAAWSHATSEMSLGSIQSWFWFGWCWFSPSSLEMHQSKYLMHSGHLRLNIWLADEGLRTNHARFHK